MRCKALRHGLPIVIGGLLSLPAGLLAQKSVSHVRVVRLSYASGTVAVRRPASTQWAKAQVNIPIQEGFEIATSAGSYAEVEFENGSTLRLGEFSQATFDQLALDADGNKLNRVTFGQGYATFHLLPEHHDVYSVKLADSTLTPSGKAEFRTDLDHGHARLEVFSGSVALATPAKTLKVGKDKVIDFNPQFTEMAVNEKQGIVKDSWDKWTGERDTQAQLSLVDQAVPSRGTLYGWNDLDVYGEWGFFPGFGYGWSPYAAAGWSPYSMGMWGWYPGMGYTWISGEPWGWLPYHYGSWSFMDGFGWFWVPGSYDAFSPALVSWYTGPGWMGWAPLGAVGAAGRPIVTTVPGAVIQNGEAITPRTVNHVMTSAGALTTRMPFEPGEGAMLPGERLSGNAEALLTPPAGTLRVSAPASILVGGEAEKEQALPQGKHSAFAPLHARLGTTLGGVFVVHGPVGEFRDDPSASFGGPNLVRGQGFDFSRPVVAGGPTLLPHGQQVRDSGNIGGPAAFPNNGAANVSGPVPLSAAPEAASHGSTPAASGGGHH